MIMSLMRSQTDTLCDSVSVSGAMMAGEADPRPMLVLGKLTAVGAPFLFSYDISLLRVGRAAILYSATTICLSPLSRLQTVL